MKYDNIAVLIPAYKPDRRLNQLVDDLLAANFKRIVVVDDGGGEAFAPSSPTSRARPRCSPTR